MNEIETIIQNEVCSSGETILWYHYRKPSAFHLAVTSLWFAFGLSLFFLVILGTTELLSAMILLLPILVFFGLPLAVTLSDALIYVVTNCRVLMISRYAYGRKVSKEVALERVKTIAFSNQSRNPSLLFELGDERDAVHKEFDEKLAGTVQSLWPLLRLVGHGLPVGIRSYANPTISFERMRDFDMYSYIGLCELIGKTAHFKGRFAP